MEYDHPPFGYYWSMIDSPIGYYWSMIIPHKPTINDPQNQAASARHRCATRSEALAASLRSKLTELEAKSAFRVAERGTTGGLGKMLNLYEFMGF